MRSGGIVQGRGGGKLKVCFDWAFMMRVSHDLNPRLPKNNLGESKRHTQTSHNKVLLSFGISKYHAWPIVRPNHVNLLILRIKVQTASRTNYQ
jgi:hypothetical protein